MDKQLLVIISKKQSRIRTYSKFLTKCFSYFIFTILATALYASDACKYSEFDLNTLPDDPMTAIHNFTTVGHDLTFMAYSFKNEPAVQLITLKQITNKYFEIVTIRDLHSQKNLALDIIQKTSPKEYFQIRVVGKNIQDRKSTKVTKVIHIVDKKKVIDEVYVNKILPHWIKISLNCRNGTTYGIFDQKERILAEVYYTKNKHGWVKSLHHHLYPADHPMVN